MMMTTQTPTTDDQPDDLSWFTRTQLASAVGLGEAQLDRMREKFSNAFEKRVGKRRQVKIFAPSWLSMYYKDRLRVRTAEGIDSGEDDEWQEKCWEEKYYALRDSRRQRHRQLISRADVHVFMGILSSSVRQLGERLQRAYGTDAQDMVDDSIDDAMGRAEAVLAEPEEETN